MAVMAGTRNDRYAKQNWYQKRLHVRGAISIYTRKGSDANLNAPSQRHNLDAVKAFC